MMKRLSLLALLVIFVLPIFAKHVDVETAKNVARTFWTQNVGKATRSTISDVTSQTEFTNFYIFNTDGGFVIVSADDIATPILGYSENGNFSSENIPVNMYEWLQVYENDIQQGISNGVTATAEIAADWATLSSGRGIAPKRSRAVSALVSTRWNQSAPYNLLCPYDSGEGERTVTGCVATAMAQIMKYWNYPAQGNGEQTYTPEGYAEQTANFGATTYDWDNMLNTYTNSATTAQKNAVATLMYHCGVAVQMSYGVSRTGGSGAVTVGPYDGTAEYAMKNYFLYKPTLAGRYKSNYNETDWKDMLYADLDASRPIIYTGRGGGSGHCFICDGYNNNDQFHFNWGWGGYCDGFFAITNLNPGTEGIGSGSGTYNESQSAIFGIEPNAGLFAIPNALTFSGLGGNNTFMVRSSTASSDSWTATSDQTWLTLNPATGTGSGANTTVTAIASRNNTAFERTATITITQGEETATVTVVQPSGIPNDPGCFGTDGYDSFYPIESGKMIVICGEGFGYFTTGHKVTKVKFTTVDGAATSNYTSYTNNSFTIKIYENGSTESLSSGYTSNIAGAMGTQVYSQNYTQSYFGEQEVTLNTPYTIDETKNFWIAIIANGNSIFRVKLNEYGEPVSEDAYEGYAEAFDGKYLYTDTYNGTDYLNTNGTAYYTDESETELQLYSIDFTLTFCTMNPALLAVTPETLNFGSEGGNLNFTVKANDNVSANWTAVSSESWLTLSATSGSGSGATTTVTATAEENVSGAERSATITVTHGSETKVITVTQPDGSIAPTNRWYGYTDWGSYTRMTNGYQVIIRPENYGNFAAGNKILKVKFSTYNGLRTSYTDYINTNFTIKIYEGSSMDANLANNGLTTAIDACLGTAVYSQDYTAESFSESDYYKDHIVELETPYTIRDGVNFWISVVVNGNTLFLLDYVDIGSPIDESSYTSSMAVNAASGNYLYTDSYNSTNRLRYNGVGYCADNECTTVQIYSLEYALLYYISDGDSPYMPSSDLEAMFLESNESNYYASETMSIGATDAIVVYPAISNEGPENATEPTYVSLKIGSEILAQRTVNSLTAGRFTYMNTTSPYSYSISAETMNEMLLTGTFDICLTADYSGNDNNESNNTTCITVTRATPSFTISASANPTAGGNVTGAGTYDLGEGVNLVATPVAGYDFTNWTEGETVVSTNANYSFTVTSDRTLVANFTEITYNVTATVDPANSGTISGNNSPYTYGQNVSLTATANPGFAFVNWTDEDANVVSTNANYQFTIDGNRTFVAHFEAEHYEITATANPTAGGSVSGTGTFDYNQQVTLTATANEGYTFVNWTEDDAVVSTNEQYTFNATQNRNLVANFEINTYNISASANPSVAGNISGAGEYTHGQTVTLNATANTGYTFVNWTENGSEISTNAQYSFTATADRSLVANFEAIVYTIAASANPVEGGTVSGAGDYPYSQTVTLNATANTGYSFVNWTENSTVVSTEANYTFNVSGNRTLVANFEINTYTVTAVATPTVGGNVAIDIPSQNGVYNYGTNLVITATANEGYHFVQWSDGETASQRNYTVVADADFIAYFAQDGVPEYTIAATANPTQGGTVEGAGVYEEDSEAVLTATANTGYTFVNWTENGSVVSINAQYSFTVTTDRTLVANFTINNYTISASANPTEGGSVEGTGDYTHGQNVTLTATANTGYTFTNWTEGSEVVSTNAEYSFTATADRTLVANFTINGYTISATANPTEGGSVEGTGDYTHGQNVTLTATANTGYTFNNWTEGTEVVSTNAEYSFTATADRTLVANFTINGYTISATANPTEGGSVEGTGNYNYGQNVTLTATANTGYTFTNWTEGSEIVSTNAEYSFTATADRTLVANFSLNTYTIIASASEGGSILPDGVVVVNAGADAIFTILANEGYRLVSVIVDADTENEEDVTEQITGQLIEPVYTFTNVNANHTIHATFEAIPVTTYTITVSIQGNGTVTYEGNELENYETVTVAEGATPEFTIIPAEGYMIAGITIGEAEEGADVVFDGEVDDENVYTFDAVTANMIMTVTFVRMQYTITVNAGEHGTVTYNGEEITWVNAEEGSTPAFVITPDENYQIDVLSVDGNEVELTEEQLSGFTYIFEPVMSDLTFSVTFTRLNAADMFEAGSIAVFPNPNNGKFILSMESIKGDVTCQIVNANGSVIETREVSVTDGSEFVFDCDVANGVYFVRIIAGDKVWTERVVIER